MKLTDIIRKDSEIREGHSRLFIAENDFYFNGLPILKDSLVYYYDGKNRITVNMMLLGIFQKRNVPDLISEELPEDNHLNYLVEKCSSCKFEINKLHGGGHGIWHNNHFDKWDNSCFRDYNERINEIPFLEYSGITFSSFMYTFNTLTNSLDYFINVKPFKLNIKGKSIELPKFLEIDISGRVIIPLGKMEYFGIQLESVISWNENGILTGNCAEEFTAEITKDGKIDNILISKGFPVEISSDGKMEIQLFNGKTHKVENFKIKKCN